MSGSLRPCIFVIFGLLFPYTLLADSSVGGESDVTGNNLTDETMALDEVVVTATRTPKTLKDVPVVTRLISSEEIARTDATNIQDLLTDELPGLEFGYSMSQETALYMNGFGGSAILFLVDGERMAGETLDNVDYNRLNLENVARVEIVKGAASALYGANAVGGVVNIITRENTDPWHINLNTRFRSFGSEWRAGGDVSFNTSKLNSNTSIQYLTSRTVRLADAFDTQSNFHSIYGGHSLNVKERLIYRISDNLRLSARGGYFYRVSNRATYDDHYHDYNGGLRGVWNIDESRNLEISYSYDRYDKSRFIDGLRTHEHDYSNRQHIVHGLFTKFWGANGLTVGADYMHDYLCTYQFTENAVHTQTSADAFVQFDYNPLTWFNLIASVRDDYFSASRSNAVTSRIALMFKPNPLSVRASYAGGFRAPSLKEMYMCFDMAGLEMIYGNPDLKPERSHNFNLSLERSGDVRGSFIDGSYNATLTGYFNYYDSRITTTEFFNPEEDGATYINEDGVRVMGFDLNARYRTKSGLGASLSYNYLHIAGRTIDSQFNQPRPHSATWRLDYEKRISKSYKFYVALSGRYLSKPISNYPADGAYSLWKLTFQQTVLKGLNINIVVDNLLNYKPKVYYWNTVPTNGISCSIGLSINID
ncbi:MAG: TonB-dependent receptor [Muribaculaceae bacterium]|nr:TonB-dependent receptor [Muribaculaceae bacterium]